MSGSPAKSVIADFHRRLWVEQDLGAVADCFAPDAVVHVSSFDSSAVQTIRDDATRYFAAFAEVESIVDDLLADGDKVVLRWTTHGTHVGPYGQVAATQRRIRMTGVDVFRVDDGLVVECWSVWDGLDVFDQLGALPDLW